MYGCSELGWSRMGQSFGTKQVYSTVVAVYCCLVRKARRCVRLMRGCGGSKCCEEQVLCKHWEQYVGTENVMSSVGIVCGWVRLMG